MQPVATRSWSWNVTWGAIMGSRTNLRCNKEHHIQNQEQVQNVNRSDQEQLQQQIQYVTWGSKEPRLMTKKLPNAQCTSFFKTGKQIKRPDIPNDSFAFTAVALQRTKNHSTTETWALKHIKPNCRRSLLLKVINFDRISQERAILPFWTKTKLYRTPEDLKTCQH